MVIGMGYVTIQIPEAHSLKEKRRIVRSLIQRVQSRFNVSIAEVDYQENWQLAEIGVVCVSNSSRHADEMTSNVINFMESNLAGGFIAEVHTDVMHTG